MPSRKFLQVPELSRAPRNNRRPQPARGFWEWLLGGYYRGG